MDRVAVRFRGGRIDFIQPERKENSFIKYRYVVTVLGFFAFVQVYTMRVNLSVAIVDMVSVHPGSSGNNTTVEQSCPELLSSSTNHSDSENFHVGDFDWTAVEQNNIQGTFFYGYVITNILAGRIAELIGSKWIIAIGVMFSSIITIASPYIAHLGPVWFAASRVLVGLGVGIIYPAIHCSLGLWYPQKERGLMYSIIHSGARFAAAVTFPVAGLLCSSSLGWPSAFYVFGAFGIFWCIFWCLLMYDNPEDHPFISESELKYISSNKEDEGQATEKVPIPWINVLTSIHVWATAVALFGTEWGFNVLISDLPTYMSHILHFKLEENGFLDALPYICDMIFTVISGIIADWLMAKKYLSVTNTRKLFTALGSFLPAACLLIITFLGCNRTAIVAVMALAVGFGGVRIPGSAVAIVDMAPNFSGTIMGLCNGVSQLSGVISLPIVGMLTDGNETRRQWDYVFYIAVGVYVVTAIFFLIFGTAKLQPWSTSKNPEHPKWITWLRTKLCRRHNTS